MTSSGLPPKHRPVTPAKAGIQGKALMRLWISAYAGMTKAEA